MNITSADEFIRLRYSERQEDRERAVSQEASLDVWKDVIARYPDARIWVVRNKTVPLEILAILLADREPQVRYAVAMKRKLTSSLLDQLATDRDESIRMRVAMHRNTSTVTLEALRNDPWVEIRTLVSRRLCGL